MVAIAFVDDDWISVAPGADPDGAGPATRMGFDAFATVQGAINGTSSGGSVFVNPGVYSSLTTINKPLTLSGTGMWGGCLHRTGEIRITNGAANVTIEALNIEKIVANGAGDNLTIAGNTFFTNGSNGTIVKTSVANRNNWQIIDNTNLGSIRLHNVTDALVSGNVIYNNDTTPGILVNNAPGANIWYNEILGSGGAGIDIRNTGAIVGDVSVEGNVISGANNLGINSSGGIAIRHPGYNVSVTNNAIAESHNGIFIGRDALTGLTIEYNDLSVPQSNGVAFRNSLLNPQYTLSHTNLIGSNTLVNAIQPPLPPDMGGGSQYWDMGVLEPAQIDTVTGQRWDFGTVTRSEVPGTSFINENIGGDDVNDRAQFSVTQSVMLNLHTNGAIAEVINTATNSVVVGSSDSYVSNLTALLSPGSYILSYSSEASIPAAFTSTMELTASV